LKKLELKQNPFLYKYKGVFYNHYNSSIFSINLKEKLNNKVKLIKLGFLVPILTDYNSISKSNLIKDKEKKEIQEEIKKYLSKGAKK
jgi:hypothetical protein